MSEIDPTICIHTKRSCSIMGALDMLNRAAHEQAALRSAELSEAYMGASGKESDGAYEAECADAAIEAKALVSITDRLVEQSGRCTFVCQAGSALRSLTLQLSEPKN